MNISKYINENRAGLTAYIKKAVPNFDSINDAERRLWILNDEFLYNSCRLNIPLEDF